MSLWDDLTGAAEDAWNWVEGAVTDVVNWMEEAFDDLGDLMSDLTPDQLEDLVGNQLDSLIGALETLAASMPALREQVNAVIEDLEQTARNLVEAASNLAEGALELAGNAAGKVLDTIDAGAQALGDAAVEVVEFGFGVVEDAWNSTVGPAVDAALEALEDAGVFDAIDAVTLGALDMSYDGEDFHGDLGISGLLHLGIDIGAEGVGAEGEAFGYGSFDLGVGSDGSIDIGMEGGITGLYGLGFDLGLSDEGLWSLSADGEIHIPSPTVGTLDLELGAHAEQTGTGYGFGGEVTAGYTSASGSYVGGGYHAEHSKDGDETTTMVGGHEVVGQVGVGEIRTEQNLTIHGRGGEIIGTEGTLVIEGDTIAGDFHEEVTVWDTRPGHGAGVPGVPPVSDPSDRNDDDDVTRPRRPRRDHDAAPDHSDVAGAHDDMASLAGVAPLTRDASIDLGAHHGEPIDRPVPIDRPMPIDAAGQHVAVDTTTDESANETEFETETSVDAPVDAVGDAAIDAVVVDHLPTDTPSHRATHLEVDDPD